MLNRFLDGLCELTGQAACEVDASIIYNSKAYDLLVDFC